MGLLDFFKKAVQNSREGMPVREEHTILKKEPVNHKQETVSDEKFNDRQFQYEVLAYALWKYEANNNRYEAVYASLADLEGTLLSDAQKTGIVESLKIYNDNKRKKERFKQLVTQVQQLVNEEKKQEAFDMVYNAYVEDSSDIDVVALISQLAELVTDAEGVLVVFDKLIAINPGEAYNITYKKGLYLKDMKRYQEAIDIFRAQNIQLKFAWNYYQVAIIENLLGDIPACLEDLEKAFELDPAIKADAKTYPELANLHSDQRFMQLIAGN